MFPFDDVIVILYIEYITKRIASTDRIHVMKIYVFWFSYIMYRIYETFQNRFWYNAVVSNQIIILLDSHQGPLLSICFDFNPSLEKQLHPR